MLKVKKQILVALTKRQLKQYELVKSARGHVILLLNKENEKLKVLDPVKWEVIEG